MKDDDKIFKEKIRQCYLNILNREPETKELFDHIQWMKENNISLNELPQIFKNPQSIFQKIVFLIITPE